MKSAGGWQRLMAALVLLVAAPVFGEVLSTATAPLDLLVPWNLALMVGMYGCGALLCREIALRFGLGWPGLFLLGAAYGVFEEGLVDRFWYDPAHWSDTGVGDYSVVGHVNVLLATHLTVFHTAVSIVGSIVVVERLFPARRSTSWIGPGGMGVCGVALAAVLFVSWEEFYQPPAGALLVPAVLLVLLPAAALWTRRRPAPATASSPPAEPARLARVGWIAFVCTAAHFVTVYAIPSTGLPWPFGVALVLAPVAVGSALIRRKATGGLNGPDALRVVTGIMAFFLLLDIFIGLGGRFDLTAAGLGLGVFLWWLRRRSVPPATTPGDRPQTEGEPSRNPPHRQE